MNQEGPRYANAAAASAEICNLWVGADLPKAEIFGRVLWVILQAMARADEELAEDRLKPSRN